MDPEPSAGESAPQRFRLGRLDHVHVRVPNRDEAAAWYATHLGFEPIADQAFWAESIDGGPLQISADGGETALALFESPPGEPLDVQRNGVAFSVDADVFIAFARSLPGAIPGRDGGPLRPEDVIDFDLCWAFDFTDPWGNRFELNCYDHARVRAELIEHDRIPTVRYWPRESYDRYLAAD